MAIFNIQRKLSFQQRKMNKLSSFVASVRTHFSIMACSNFCFHLALFLCQLQHKRLKKLLQKLDKEDLISSRVCELLLSLCTLFQQSEFIVSGIRRRQTFKTFRLQHSYNSMSSYRANQARSFNTLECECKENSICLVPSERWLLLNA